MCGNYYISKDSVLRIQNAFVYQGLRCAFEDVFPGQHCLVLINDHGTIVSRSMKWGLSTKSGSLINARAETVCQKPTFSSLVDTQRCIVVADAYYEWNAAKEKVTFSRKDGKILWMAGIYNEDGFVILTTRPNASVRSVHDRMPLILEKEEMIQWLCKDYKDLLEKVPTLLEKKQSFEQLGLF